MGNGIYRLSAKQVEHAKDGDHNDGGGLLLRIRSARVSSSGKTLPATAAWVFRYTSPTGKKARREMGLGPLNAGDPGGSLKEARRQADKARTQVQAGIDPIDARESDEAGAKAAAAKSKAEKKRQELTLARAARAYHERVIEPRLSAKHGQQWIASLENHIPKEIWHAPIAVLGDGSPQRAPGLLRAMAGVRALEEKEAGIPETLRRIRQRLETVFEDAIFHGYCTSNPAAAIKRKMREELPAKVITAYKAMDYREVPAFMQRLRAVEGVAARCLEFAVLTASRTGEVIGARWSEFDMEQGVWRVPADRMKAGEEHVVQLSKRAREVLAGQVGLDQQLVFPSPMNRGKPMGNAALLQMLDRLGEHDRTTPHGLCRACFSTWSYETAAARPDVIEACLAHKESDRVKAAYNRAQFTEERRALMAAWSEYLNKPRMQLVHAA